MSAGHYDNNKNGAIPHIVGAYNHVTEVEYVPGKCTLPDQSPRPSESVAIY